MSDTNPVAGSISWIKDGDVFTVSSAPIAWSKPTAALRFVERDGRRILQQEWVGHSGRADFREWRDVPLEVETTA